MIGWPLLRSLTILHGQRPVLQTSHLHRSQVSVGAGGHHHHAARSLHRVLCALLLSGGFLRTANVCTQSAFHLSTFTLSLSRSSVHPFSHSYSRFTSAHACAHLPVSIPPSIYHRLTRLLIFTPSSVFTHLPCAYRWMELLWFPMHNGRRGVGWG